MRPKAHCKVVEGVAFDGIFSAGEHVSQKDPLIRPLLGNKGFFPTLQIVVVRFLLHARPLPLFSSLSHTPPLYLAAIGSSSQTQPSPMP